MKAEAEINLDNDVILPQEQAQASKNHSPDNDEKQQFYSLYEEDDAILLDSYNFHKTRVIIHLELLPSPQNEPNRTVNIGVGIKNEPPIFATTTLSEISLPPVIQKMLEQLESQMPERATTALQRKKLQQLEVQKQLTTKTSTCKLPPAKPLPKPESNSPNTQQQLTLF